MKDYLNRISIQKDLSPDLNTLRELQRLHLYNIPFENLNIHKNVEIILDFDILSKKILNSRRGGYCYELNGLFYHLLKETGFDVKMISARVSSGDGEFGQEFDHLALIVNINDGQWLADVGFGDSFLEPLKFELDIVQKDKTGFYRITKHDDQYFRLSKSSNGKEFTDEYLFSSETRQWSDFQPMNKYHQTSPKSHFTQKKICSIATETGRISISNDKLTITENGEKKIIEIKNEEEFDEKLFQHFGIKLSVKS